MKKTPRNTATTGKPLPDQFSPGRHPYLKYQQGIGLDVLDEPVPTFNKAPCEKVIEGQNNTYIVLGRDRPGPQLAKAPPSPVPGLQGVLAHVARGPYGPRGFHGAGSIDIVAGRHSPDIKMVAQVDKVVDPDFVKDAARIYISQLTDIDKNFNIGGHWKAFGSGTEAIAGYPACKESTARSAIGIKADAVRVIGREGVKIVTGGDVKNSLGGPTGGGFLPGVGGIDLIAGNDDSDMQPLVKGNYLEFAIEKLVDHINALNGIVDSFLKYQMRLNKAFALHTHNSPFFGLPTSPSETALREGRKVLISQLNRSKSSLALHKINMENYKKTYLSVGGSGYICSKYNKTN